jgi:hypothetical protein
MALHTIYVPFSGGLGVKKNMIGFSYISLWFVYVCRRRLREYVPNLLTKFNLVRAFIRYFHTSIDVDFPSVPNLLTKI